MDFQQQSYSIDLLVQRIRTSKMALPDFQRDFVWNPARVVELLDSVSRQWPIGSLLLLSGPQPFAIRQIDSGPMITDGELDLYVLDGQQRLTSLFHAVADVSDYCYFVDFRALDRGEDEYLSWERRSVFNSKYPTVEARSRAGVALISDVWDVQRFYKWLECLSSHQEKSRCVELRETRIPGLHAKVYKVMAIVLDQTIALEALARIFETLNRTGVALNAFDLMVAALYPSGFKLRDEWESAKERHQILNDICPDELEPIKLIALLVRGLYGKRESRGVRQGDLLRLDRHRIREMWKEGIELYVMALEYCRDNFGVRSSDLVPSWAMILGVAAWLKFKGADAEAIKQWWISRLFTQLFSQAGNTRIISEVDLLFAHEIGSDIWPSAQPLTPTDLPAKANGVLMRGIGALIVKSGGLDPRSGEPLSKYSEFSFRALQDDGALSRIRGSDSLAQVVVVSAETDKSLGRVFDFAKLGDVGKKALVSQGVDLDTGRREIDHMGWLMTLSYVGGKK